MTEAHSDIGKVAIDELDEKLIMLRDKHHDGSWELFEKFLEANCTYMREWIANYSQKKDCESTFATIQELLATTEKYLTRIKVLKTYAQKSNGRYRA